MRFLRWGTPQYCASNTRHARLKSSATISPAFAHLSGRSDSTVSSCIGYETSKFEIADFFEDGLEVRTLVGAECAGDVLPDDIPRIFSIGCTPHFFYNSYGLIKEVTS